MSSTYDSDRAVERGDTVVIASLCEGLDDAEAIDLLHFSEPRTTERPNVSTPAQ